MRKFKSIGTRKGLLYCGFGDTQIANWTLEKECQSESKLHKFSNFISICERDNVYKLIFTSKYGRRQGEKYWFNIKKIQPSAKACGKNYVPLHTKCLGMEMKKNLAVNKKGA